MKIPRGNKIAIEIRGKLGAGAGLGMCALGAFEAGFSNPFFGTYQIRKTKKSGEFQIVARDMTPSNPRTPRQQANRQRFAEAMRAWHALPDSEKKIWKEKRKFRTDRAHALFIKDFLKKNY